MKNCALLLVIALLISIAVFGANKFVVAETIEEDTYAIEKLAEFTQLFPKREAYTQGERDAANYIKEQFADMGLTPFFDEYLKDVEGYEGEKSQNVVAVIDSDTSYFVVIGAHYDNVGYNNADGASDNGSGVAVLLSLANSLKDVELPFDVVFAAFGAEEEGMVGSYAFVYDIISLNEKCLLYINLDSIACGDYCYIYGEDVKTPYVDFFLETYEKSGDKVNTIKNVPISRNISLISLYGKPYYAEYYSSDSAVFREIGIPTVAFFCGNLDYAYSYTESAEESKRVMHTQKDNLDYIDGVYGEQYKKNMLSVQNCVLKTLTSYDFYANISGARKFMIGSLLYSSLFPVLVGGALIIAAIILYFNKYKRLQKDAYLTESGVKSFKIFSQPKDDEIFTFKN
jgi:alkaline phosphatase isozyme conversion protein